MYHSNLHSSGMYPCSVLSRKRRIRKRRILFCTITININIKTIKSYNILSCSRIFVSWINLRPRAATHSNYTDVTRAASCAAARATGPLRSPFCMGARGWTCPSRTRAAPLLHVIRLFALRAHVTPRCARAGLEVQRHEARPAARGPG